MCGRWMWFVSLVAAAAALQLTDEQYYQMPQLFDMDDYDACVSRRGGEYCLGTFQLSAGDNKLFDVMKEYSENDVNFNHTLLHRGYCVTTRCAHIDEASAEKRFAKCVAEWTEENYGLKAKLSELNYCKTGASTKRPIDHLDVIVACLIGVLVLMNLIGTAYEVMRNPDNKPNKYIISWSLISSWRRLTAKYDDGDPRLLSLGPLQGIKAISTVMVMTAHTVVAYNLTYVRNVLFLEKFQILLKNTAINNNTINRNVQINRDGKALDATLTNLNPLSMLVYNATACVQTFILIASFLFVYNMLLHQEKNPKDQVGLHKVPLFLIHRLIRVMPTYMFIIGITVTWWEYVSDGAMWSPIMEQERINCRDKWWVQLLFVNNFVKTDKQCLLQAWYLAADTQLYVLVTILTVIFVRWPGSAIKTLIVMFFSAIIGNFFLYYHWGLKAFVFLARPEAIRKHFVGIPSFYWHYISPWGSLPSSLLGILLAFVYYRLEKAEFKPNEYRFIRVAYRLSVPMLLAWVLFGNCIMGLTDPVHLAIFTALERPVFGLIVTIFLFGALNKIDSLYWRFLTWRGWQIISRMSFSIYMVHYHYNLSQVAAITTAATASAATVGGHLLVTVFMSVLTALPVYLFVETPAQQFLQTLVQ